eukprot:TRINITY_DN5491_c0_g1_i1.p1 TRINITY_DN5491_c0_g1~~TRINITY_DN5491_c0_g1_i1.p1  ORF type:complete len:141 (-),score=11.54 TRINITY_DN5491_c0_g1_i1:41-463(-)
MKVVVACILLLIIGSTAQIKLEDPDRFAAVDGASSGECDTRETACTLSYALETASKKDVIELAAGEYLINNIDFQKSVTLQTYNSTLLFSDQPIINIGSESLANCQDSKSKVTFIGLAFAFNVGFGFVWFNRRINSLQMQ